MTPTIYVVTEIILSYFYNVRMKTIIVYYVQQLINNDTLIYCCILMECTV